MSAQARVKLLLAAAAILASTSAALGQTGSVWDGVYSDAQAEHGGAKYAQECAMCHGRDQEGNGEAPPLVGHFIPDWNGTSLADLFEKIQTTMPLFAPGTLSANDTADVLAFLLKANGFPSGAKALEPGDGLKLINFETAPHAGMPHMKSRPAK
jgi:S-disulfanyl-L-cysteine oxidoreductase SoxD